MQEPIQTALLSGFKNDKPKSVFIHPSAKIHDNVRIQLDGHLKIEAGVTLHHHVTILGRGDCWIKSGSWIGQYTHLDCEGGIEIGKDCCIGFNCHLWSHVSRVPQWEAHNFHRTAKTILEDRVWLMGGMISISPGVTIGHAGIIFTNSVVTQSTKPSCTYGGAPARLIPQYNLTVLSPTGTDGP